MSIASQLTTLQANLTNAYTAISNKGGTIPSSKTMANLPTAINSISTGGSSGGNVGTKTTSLSSQATSITFTGLLGNPTWFMVFALGDITVPSSSSSGGRVTFVGFDGTTVFGHYVRYSSSTRSSKYTNSYFTKSYSNGSLTITSSSSSNGGYFYNVSSGYKLIYGY